MKPSLPVRATRKLLRPLRTWMQARELKAAGRQVAGFRLRNPVVMVLMSGGLHVAQLALARIPRNVPVILVLNGLDAWEAAWVRRRLTVNEILELRSPRRHSDVIDLLIDHLNGDFGLLDYDCFVLRPEWFRLMARVGPGSSVNGCFPFSVAGTGLELPHTFFLFLNQARLRQLKRTHGVGAADLTWEKLPPGAQVRLAALGFGPSRYPEPDRPYFDTLRALLLLGLSDGLACSLVGRLPNDPARNPEMLHVGGISPRNLVFNLWLYRGAYFWRNALRKAGDEALANHYRAKFGNIEASSLAAEFPDYAAQVDTDLLRFFDEVIASTPLTRVSLPDYDPT